MSKPGEWNSRLVAGGKVRPWQVRPAPVVRPRPATWSEANPQGRWRAYTYDELMARDKANLDLFWLRDESLEDSANLPEPDVLAAEIVEDLRAALEQFAAIAEELGE